MIVGGATELLFHLFQHLRCDMETCSRPSGMDGCDHPLSSIDHENGKAVCGENPKESIWRIRDQGIVFQKRGKGAERFLQDEDPVFLDLIEKNQICWIETQGLCDEMLVPGDMIDRITAVNAQVERFVGEGLTHLAGETMPNPSKFGHLGILQNKKALLCSQNRSIMDIDTALSSSPPSPVKERESDRLPFDTPQANG
jgi:hypothetical protein